MNNLSINIEKWNYSILWPVFIWYTGMCSPNRDQSGQWRPISMTSQWLLILTSQWIMTLLWMHIVKSQWIMKLLGTSIVMSQWIISLLCVHIMASQCIMTLLWTSYIMYFLLYAYQCVILLRVACDKHKHKSCVLLRLTKHSLVLVIMSFYHCTVYFRHMSWLHQPLMMIRKEQPEPPCSWRLVNMLPHWPSCMYGTPSNDNRLSQKYTR